MLLPLRVRIGTENGIAGKFLPDKSIRTLGIPDRIRFILFARRVPHFIPSCLLIPQYAWTHNGRFLPRFLRQQNRLIAYPFKMNPIRTDCTEDMGGSIRLTCFILAGIPHMIRIAVLHDGRTVQFILPAFLRYSRPDADFRLRPVYAVSALYNGNAFPGAPGKIHGDFRPFIQYRNIETRPVFSSKHRIIFILLPISLRSMLQHK